MKKYSDLIVDWLIESGYTHCFFLAGGNIMHLLDSVRTKMICIPVIHEAAAGMAVEYFNATQKNYKSFALVTAGPGLTNIVTAVAGAWQESRELLIIGGQVKSSDLSLGQVRQRGIQEIDGVELLSSITRASISVSEPISRKQFLSTINLDFPHRQGPVFFEICLDVQGALMTEPEEEMICAEEVSDESLSDVDLEIVISMLAEAQRPIFLIGGGINREIAKKIQSKFLKLNIPVMCTFNGADRFNHDYELYLGRPNTWGQRYSNIIIQQSDLILALGTRLGLQQTGFNWEEFVPVGKIIQVDIDEKELRKGHPRVDLGINTDANTFVENLVNRLKNKLEIDDWLEFTQKIKSLVPVLEDNVCSGSNISTYVFWNRVCEYFPEDAIFIPSSSGGTFTSAYQAIELRGNQQLISNKSLASMGYGLSASIGAALANPEQIIVMGEGDGGFAQHLQELGTISAQSLNIKIFVFDNDGYASIRMTQRNYFGGEWLGCDRETKVGLPNWRKIVDAYDIDYVEMTSENLFTSDLVDFLLAPGPKFVLVKSDPLQTFYPKIASRVATSGKMESSPLHLMEPPLGDQLALEVFKYIRGKD